MLGAAFVASLAGVFIVTALTRSPYYAATIWAALWAIVFAPTYFYTLEAVDVYAYATGGVLLATVFAALVGDALAHPVLVSSKLVFYPSVAAFFAVFFFVAGATNDNDGALDLTRPAFLTGTVVIGDGVAYSMGALLTLTTLALLAYVFTLDRMVVFYFVGMALAVALPSLALVNGYVWLAAVLAFVVDAALLVTGVALERSSPATARLYRAGATRLAMWLPFVLVTLAHTLFFVFGAAFLDNDSVQELFAFPHFALVLVVGIVIVGALCGCVYACSVGAYRPRSPEPIVEPARVVAQTTLTRRRVTCAESSDEFAT